MAVTITQKSTGKTWSSDNDTDSKPAVSGSSGGVTITQKSTGKTWSSEDKAETQQKTGTVGNVLKGAVKSTASGYTNAGGTLLEILGKIGSTLQDKKEKKQLAQDWEYFKQSASDFAAAKNSGDEQAAKIAQIRMRQAQYRIKNSGKQGDYYDTVNQEAVQSVYDTADRLASEAAADIDAAKEGKGKGGSFLVDTGVAGTQLLGDVATAAVTGGTALAPMAVRSFGSAAQEARQSGATLGQQAAYGVGSSAVSVATEKLANIAAPFKKAFGSGVLDNALKKVTAKPGGLLLVSSLSEGGEEIAEAVAQPVLQRLTYDPDAAYDADWLADALYSGGIGAVLGGLGGVGNVVTRKTARNQAQEAAGTQTATQEGNVTPTTQNAAEGAQNAAPEASVMEQEAARLFGQNEAAPETNIIVESGPSAINARNQANNTLAYTLATNIDKLADLHPVSNLTGNEMNDRSVKPDEQMRALFKRVGNKVFRNGFGDVQLNEYGIASMLNHRPLNRSKMLSLAAVPDVIRDGRQINVSENWKGRGYASYIFAAPVQVGTSTVYVAAVVDQRPDNKFYLSEMVDSAGNYVRINESPSSNSKNGVTDGAGAPGGDGVTARPEGLSVGNAPSAPKNGAEPASPYVDSTIAQGAENVNIEPVTDTVPTGSSVGAADAGFDPHSNLQNQTDKFHPVNPNSAQRIREEQGRVPTEVPVVNPKTGLNVTKAVSTILNSPLTSPEMAPILENSIADGDFDYTTVTDRDSVRQAQEKLGKIGYRNVATVFMGRANEGKIITKADMADAVSAYNAAVTAGDHATAFELAVAISQSAHTSAQVVQAMNLLNRMTPEGKLLTLRRVVDRMNDKRTRKVQTRGGAQADADMARTNYVEQGTGFRISDELATNYLMAETDAERDAAWSAIITSIADEIPSGFREKADFWRYASMLTNPTTHIKNIGGNALQYFARNIKNVVGAGIERAVLKDPAQRTKAILTKADKGLKQFAKEQYAVDQKAAMGTGKYSDASAFGIEREIMDARKVFEAETAGKLAAKVRKVTPDPFLKAVGAVNKGVQKVGDWNTNAMDVEDLWFNRPAYVSSFAQALKAKGISADEAAAGVRSDEVEAARAYAISEAQKATYRNTTALSEFVSKLGRYSGDGNWVEKAASFAVDAFQPFRRTPTNVTTTGLDYSPLGLFKGLYQGLVQVRRGECEAADVIDSVASGLTGTGILALGAFLAAEGLLHVRAGDDDREQAFEESMGNQDYALQIGDKSYSLDWAVPAAMPLFAGAAIMESVSEDGGTLDAVCDALLGMSDVVLETSMISSLNDLISYWSYADSKVLYPIDRAVSSYVKQFVPTIGSKVASALDDTVRKSYVEKSRGQISSDAGYLAQGIAKKIPGARNQLEPAVDLWGEEVSNGTAAERIFQSFLSPGYLKTRNTEAVTEEVRRLAEATGDSSVYPKTADKSFDVNGETKNLTAEEYTKYAKTLGQTRKQVLSKLLDQSGYRRLSDEDKAKAVSYAYEYATAKAKMAVSDYTPTGGFASGAMKSVLPVDSYILYKINSDRDGNGSVSGVESARTLNELSGVSTEKKGKEWGIRNSTTSEEKNPFTGALAKAGASPETAINILEKYNEISDTKGLKFKEKGAQFRAYVNSQGLTAAQKAAAQQTFRLFGMVPIEW